MARANIGVDGPLWVLEEHCLARQAEIECWFRRAFTQTPPLFYASVDLRNAGYKCAPVDTNIFPAGFNNLNPKFRSLVVQAIQSTLSELAPTAETVVLVPEDHTRNTRYLDNVARLKLLLEQAGLAVILGSVRDDLTEPMQLSSASGEALTFFPIRRVGDQILVQDEVPDALILNNDLSTGLPDLLSGISQIILPNPALGWYQRLKSGHFYAYQTVVEEFSSWLSVDPWQMAPLYDQSDEVQFQSGASQTVLVEKAELLLSSIQKKYDEYNIKQAPYLVLKSDAGTYGMAVMMIHDADTLKNLNRKQRTRMSSAKGGRQVTQVILQEGVPTHESMKNTGAVAEPVVYLVGRYAAGGFYRVHHKKGPLENLNAPGMDFSPFAFSVACNTPVCEQHIDCDIEDDYTVSANRCYAYSVVARLAALAAARELTLIKT